MIMASSCLSSGCDVRVAEGMGERETGNESWRSKMNTRLFSFVGGAIGAWRVARVETIAGASIAEVPSVDVVSGDVPAPPHGSAWILRGITSNDRYIAHEEKA